MAFESSNFLVAKKSSLPKSELKVECNIPVEQEIDKIFSITADVNVQSSEVLTGFINFLGVIDLCVIYCALDGSVGTIHTTCPFSSKIEDQNISVGQLVDINVKVVDHEVQNISSSNMKVLCMIEQDGVLISNENVNTIRSNAECICTKEDQMSVVRLIGNTTSVVNEESSVSIKEQVKKVLLCESQVCVKDVECGLNFVSVSGELVNRILYINNDDKFESCYNYETFKEEVELEGVTRDSIAECCVSILKEQVKTEVVEIEKGVDVKIVTPIELKIKAYEDVNIEIIRDVYSTNCELGITTESFSMTKTLACEYFENKIDGNLTLSEDKARVDKIMFIGGTNLVIFNSYISEGEIFVEGIARTNVVYLNDEFSSLNSVNIEVPFVVSDKTQLEGENIKTKAQAIICDVDVVVKKGREFYFDAKIKVKVDFYVDQTCAIISNVEEQEKYPEKDYSVELLFGQKGMSLWDISKQARIREELIVIQNPDVNFPLEKDTNVVVFFQNA